MLRDLEFLGVFGNFERSAFLSSLKPRASVDMFSTIAIGALALSICPIHASLTPTTTTSTITRAPRAEAATTTSVAYWQSKKISRDLWLYIMEVYNNPSNSVFVDDIRNVVPPHDWDEVDRGYTDWKHLMTETTTSTWFTKMPESAQSYWSSLKAEERRIVESDFSEMGFPSPTRTLSTWNTTATLTMTPTPTLTSTISWVPATWHPDCDDSVHADGKVDDSDKSDAVPMTGSYSIWISIATVLVSLAVLAIL